MDQVEPVLVAGRIKIPYRWPAGRVGGHFLRILQEQGRFVGLRCPRCRRVSVPPRPRCLTCRVPSDDWVEVGPRGVVTTWTRRPAGTLALIRLDGADTALLHRLLEADDPRSGMRVEPVLVDGLSGFRPAAEPR